MRKANSRNTRDSVKSLSNPKEKDKRFVVIDVKCKKRLKIPVTLAEIKKEKKFKNWELLRISRLSVMPVPKEIWDELLERSQKDS